MKYARQKRVELSDLDVNWKGCYIVIGVRGFLQVQELQRKISTLQNDLELLNIKLKRKKKGIEDLDDKNFEVALKVVDDLNGQVVDNSDELIKMFISIVKDGFISGVVYDNEKGSTREMIADDVEAFDNEVITRLASSILGSIEKKA